MDHSWKLWFSLVLHFNWSLLSLSFQKINPILFLPFYNSFFFIIFRSLKTLRVRMEEHQRNSLVVGRWLEKHPGIESVRHPGLPSHPQHSLGIDQGLSLIKTRPTDAYHVWNTERQLYRDAEAPKNKDLFTYMRWANICINTVTIIIGNLQI